MHGAVQFDAEPLMIRKPEDNWILSRGDTGAPVVTSQNTGQSFTWYNVKDFKAECGHACKEIIHMYGRLDDKAGLIGTDAKIGAFQVEDESSLTHVLQVISTGDFVDTMNNLLALYIFASVSWRQLLVIFDIAREGPSSRAKIAAENTPIVGLTKDEAYVSFLITEYLCVAYDLMCQEHAFKTFTGYSYGSLVGDITSGDLAKSAWAITTVRRITAVGAQSSFIRKLIFAPTNLRKIAARGIIHAHRVLKNTSP